MNLIDITNRTRFTADSECGLRESARSFASKQWGEEHFACLREHACKIMVLKPGHQVSLHWHRVKSETFVLIKGGLVVETYDKKGAKSLITLTVPGSSVTIEYMVPHTFYCPDSQKEETIFIEASTRDDQDDSYRINQSGPRCQDPSGGGSADRYNILRQRPQTVP